MPSGREKCTILVVEDDEDDEDVREIARAILDDLGCETIRCHSSWGTPMTEKENYAGQANRFRVLSADATTPSVKLALCQKADQYAAIAEKVERATESLDAPKA